MAKGGQTGQTGFLVQFAAIVYAMSEAERNLENIIFFRNQTKICEDQKVKTQVSN